MHPRLAEEVSRILSAPPHFRAEQLGSAAGSLNPLIQDGELDRETVREALTAAAIESGLSVNDAIDVLAWRWTGVAPSIRELYPKAFA